jgi:hypothetical protein
LLAAHETVTWPIPPVAVTPVGAAGYIVMAATFDDADSNAPFTAVTT